MIRRAAMELYVGMDVSLKQTSICVVDGKGKVIVEGEGTDFRWSDKEATA
jgi:hypothetical protein